MKFCSKNKCILFLIITFYLIKEIFNTQFLTKNKNNSEEKFTKFPCENPCNICQETLYSLKNHNKIECNLTKCKDLCLMVSNRYYSGLNPHLNFFIKNQIGTCDACFRLDLCHIEQCNNQNNFIHRTITNSLSVVPNLHILKENNIIFTQTNKKTTELITNMEIILSNLNYMNRILEKYIILWNRSKKIKKIYFKIFSILKKKNFNEKNILKDQKVDSSLDFENIIIEMNHKFKNMIFKYSIKIHESKILLKQDVLYSTNELLVYNQILNNYSEMNQEIFFIISDIFNISYKIKNEIQNNIRIVDEIKLEIKKKSDLKEGIETVIDKNSIVLNKENFSNKKNNILKNINNKNFNGNKKYNSINKFTKGQKFSHTLENNIIKKVGAGNYHKNSVRNKTLQIREEKDNQNVLINNDEDNDIDENKIVINKRVKILLDRIRNDKEEIKNLSNKNELAVEKFDEKDESKETNQNKNKVSKKNESEKFKIKNYDFLQSEDKILNFNNDNKDVYKYENTENQKIDKNNTIEKNIKIKVENNYEEEKTENNNFNEKISKDIENKNENFSQEIKKILKNKNKFDDKKEIIPNYYSTTENNPQPQEKQILFNKKNHQPHKKNKISSRFENYSHSMKKINKNSHPLKKLSTYFNENNSIEDKKYKNDIDRKIDDEKFKKILGNLLNKMEVIDNQYIDLDKKTNNKKIQTINSDNSPYTKDLTYIPDYSYVPNEKFLNDILTQNVSKNKDSFKKNKENSKENNLYLEKFEFLINNLLNQEDKVENILKNKIKIKSENNKIEKSKLKKSYNINKNSKNKNKTPLKLSRPKMEHEYLESRNIICKNELKKPENNFTSELKILKNILLKKLRKIQSTEDKLLNITETLQEINTNKNKITINNTEIYEIEQFKNNNKTNSNDIKINLNNENYFKENLKNSNEDNLSVYDSEIQKILESIMNTDSNLNVPKTKDDATKNENNDKLKTLFPLILIQKSTNILNENFNDLEDEVSKNILI